MSKQKKKKQLFRLACAILASAPISVYAAEQAPAQGTGAEEVKIEQIKQKYWAGGDEAQVGVVQNRAYSKANRFTLGVGGGVSFNDPFLSTKIIDTHFGYNFSEYFAIEVMYWKIFASGSSAYGALRDSGKDANINPQKAYYGVEALWSIMYGKLSFMGQKIIYYDLHLTAGGGMMDTETGKDPTGTVGLGQRFYFSNNTSLRIDYRTQVYREKLVEKVIPQKLGQDAGTRYNWGHVITVGIDFMFGGGAKK